MIERFVSAIEGVAFWAAITLPVVYLPVLLWSGTSKLAMEGWLAVIALHMITLVIGHRHNEPEPNGPSFGHRSSNASGEDAGR